MTLSRNNTYNCTQSNIASTTESADLQQDLHAVLYIVVTLLFYSLGIIIGIVLYLKREKQECEEEKLYEEFISLREDPYSTFRFQQVQQVAARLNYLQEKKIKRNELESVGSESLSKNSLLQLHQESSRKDRAPAAADHSKKTNSKSVSVQTMERPDEVFTENGEPLSSVVEKLLHDNNMKMSTNSPCKEDIECGEELHGVTQTFSMQSIKDYEEEPRRSERSSLCSLEDDCTKEETDNLLENRPADDNRADDTHADDIRDKKYTTEKERARYIVTNV